MSASTQRHLGGGAGQFLGSVGVGLAGGIVGTVVLWMLLRKLRLGEVLGTSAQLATVIGVAAVCDTIREDTGLIAAIAIGLAVSNMRGFDIPARRPFFETLVQLVIGLLFVSISATVTPASLRHLVLPAVGLVAALVVFARPLIAAISTVRTDLTKGEFIVATVTIYGLTAAPAARLTGVLNPPRARPLLIGGDPWVIDLATTLRSAGLEVLNLRPGGPRR